MNPRKLLQGPITMLYNLINLCGTKSFKRTRFYWGSEGWFKKQVLKASILNFFHVVTYFRNFFIFFSASDSATYIKLILMR